MSWFVMYDDHLHEHFKNAIFQEFNLIHGRRII